MRATLSLPLLGAAILTLGALALRFTRPERRPASWQPILSLQEAGRPLPERLRERGL
jgi:hypothetical protein